MRVDLEDFRGADRSPFDPLHSVFDVSGVYWRLDACHCLRAPNCALGPPMWNGHAGSAHVRLRPLEQRAFTVHALLHLIRCVARTGKFNRAFFLIQFIDHLVVVAEL